MTRPDGLWGRQLQGVFRTGSAWGASSRGIPSLEVSIRLLFLFNAFTSYFDFAD